jgi:hypothetical protein
MERSYIFFIGVFAVLAGISLWSQNSERMVSLSEQTVAEAHAAPVPVAQQLQGRAPASSPQPLEIEAIESSAP